MFDCTDMFKQACEKEFGQTKCMPWLTKSKKYLKTGKINVMYRTRRWMNEPVLEGWTAAIGGHYQKKQK